ncbi:VWA domain-containing protein [Streptomyces pluripotens]|uniref:VWA domain-containing protein n=1 Tax=Streptomyces pluripotens TaxID=1355015 RepID=A0A221NX21_9ACTN|nr:MULTISPECIES: VWA domain-containing protein [Streptomyces]ARP70263.1 VWA domain-containing protein [Streptomyces pluripotens]ASN24521.1 VWA domain-containing protein [Streptomyces pluripotens]KIE28043.1 von Willebrand factor A [Streptomyces sp. MUSC 125]MCH0558362.1 VWA domain-containing protein [Streptomyces sp. MUM 16J]
MANFAKSTVPQFSVEVYQNEYLPQGGHEVNTIVTVTATGGGTIGSSVTAPFYPTGQRPSAAVALMVDCSGSMDYPPTKMRNARDATAAAIDTLRDGTHFAVIGGTHMAKEVYPGGGRLAVADATTRAQAKQALRRLSAGGGTAIGTWLRLADRLLSSADVTIRHGVLLTDGRNEHESPEDLREALGACAGRLTCDARGVGTDWEVKEVTGIASALLGTADIVADPSGLATDFTQMMETVMGKEVADVALRIWTPVGASLRFVKQVAPTVEDLTARRTEAGPRAGDYPTGSWGDESRDYHVCVEVPPAGLGQEMLAARVSLIVPQPDGSAQSLGAQGLVRAVWTDDMTASTSINPQVAHYTGQAELAQAIQQGLELRKSGDFDGATAKLGRAVQLASASGNADTAKLLAKVVDVVDAATGTVRLKTKVAEADEMTLETRSTKTVRVKK